MLKNPIDDLIEELDKDGIRAIENIVARKTVEQFFVDFKTTQETDYTSKKTLADSDLNNLKKCLSGFSNSEGGIIIWGVDTKSKSGDFASSLKPIKCPENFASLINQLANRCIIPVNTLVESKIIKENTDDESGFVITIIPKSNNSPHQVIEDGKFYMRSGDSFSPVPYSVLSGMFGKRPNSDIGFTFVYNENQLNFEEDFLCISFTFMIVNFGAGIARDIFFTSSAYGIGGPNLIYGTELLNKDFKGFTIESAVFSLISNVDVRLGYKQFCNLVSFNFKLKPEFNETFGIEITYGADEQSPKIATLEYSKEEMESFYNKAKNGTFDIKEFLNFKTLV